MTIVKLWDELLSEAPMGAFLMGGAIRDGLADKKPKDYDIFYHLPDELQPFPQFPNWTYRPPENRQEMQELIRRYNLAIPPNGPLPIEPIIRSIRNYDVKTRESGTVRVQLVGTKYRDPRKHFNSFDHTLTLGRYGPPGLFIDRRMFESIKTKTVTCTNTTNRIKSLERAEKAVAKIDPKGADDWTYLGF